MAGTISPYWIEHEPRLIAEARKRMVDGVMPMRGWTEISKLFPGKSAERCQQQYARAVQSGRADNPPAHTPPKDPVVEEAERRDRVRRLKEEQELLKAVAGEKSLRAFLEALADKAAARFTAPPAYRPPKAPKHATRESMGLLLSDWHSAELISREGTRGINEYNAQITSQRARRVIESAISIKSKLEAGGWRFDELVVGINGDFVPGTIHEAEKHTDAENIVLNVHGTAWILAQALRDLAAAYPRVRVYCLSGNHGRLPDAKRMQQKEPLRNWDTLVYLYAKAFLSNLTNIEWHIPNAYSCLFAVQGFTFGMMHGHDIKGWAGIPFYGIQRSTRNQNALEAARRNTINYWLISHFHSQSSLPQAAGEVFINGSLCGGTEFTVNGMGAADPPNQLMFGIHPEHGVTHRWPLYASTEPDAPAYDMGGWEIG
jgi:hypothetical protein